MDLFGVREFAEQSTTRPFGLLITINDGVWLVVIKWNLLHIGP